MGQTVSYFGLSIEDLCGTSRSRVLVTARHVAMYLRRKAIQEGPNAPPEVPEYIASRISTNIRELEGALIRVTAFASLNRQSVDLQLAEIGQQFGGRDHTTVINADRKIRSLMAERRSIYTQVTELTNRIKQQARTS